MSNVRPLVRRPPRWQRPDQPSRICSQHPHVKNIQVIDGAVNSVYDIFQATEEEFRLIFPAGHDVAFIDEVYARSEQGSLDRVFQEIWKRRIQKKDVIGIHGLLFYELENKKAYYPTRKDEEARNPDGTHLR